MTTLSYPSFVDKQAGVVTMPPLRTLMPPMRYRVADGSIEAREPISADYVDLAARMGQRVPGRRQAMVRTLMSGEALIDYAQIYVYAENRPDLPEWHECFAGQADGLCGAAAPGFLFLVIGLRTGDVGFVVELHDETPPLDDGWEEIVEVSFRPAGRTALVALGRGVVITA